MDPANIPSNPDENGAADILGSTLFVVCLATVVVLARFYVRVFIIRGTGWDVSFIFSMHVLLCFFTLSSPLSPPLLLLMIIKHLLSSVLIGFSGCLHAIDNGHELGRRGCSYCFRRLWCWKTYWRC